MDLKSLFERLEKAGATTLGQAKSALVAAGVNPEGIWCSNAELDGATKVLKPIAGATATTAPTTTAAASEKPAVAGIIDHTALALLVESSLAPRIEHMIANVGDQLHAVLKQNLDAFGDLLHILAAKPATPPAPPTPPQQA